MEAKTKKEVIIRLMMGNYWAPTENLLFLLERDLYTKFFKCPTSIFIFGILETCPHLSIGGKPVELSLEDLKELIPEILSDMNGFETTFADEDWQNLEIISSVDGNFVKKKLNTTKAYMMEFFED